MLSLDSVQGKVINAYKSMLIFKGVGHPEAIKR